MYSNQERIGSICAQDQGPALSRLCLYSARIDHHRWRLGRLYGITPETALGIDFLASHGRCSDGNMDKSVVDQSYDEFCLACHCRMDRIVESAHACKMEEPLQPTSSDALLHHR